MKPRKLLAMVLSLAITASLAVPALAVEDSITAPKYDDTEGHWAQAGIDRWSGYGVVKGSPNGNFNPNEAITRGSLAQVIVSLLGLTEKAENPYTDLKGTEWYADAILKCTAAGILKGAGQKCNAEANITRQETTVMMARALGVEPDADPDLAQFTDRAAIADWAAGAVSAMAQRGIITGTGSGAASPTIDIDRASVMAILDKAISAYANEPGTYEAKETGITLVACGGVTITGKARDILIAAGAKGGEVKLDKAAVTGTVIVTAEGVKVSAGKDVVIRNESAGDITVNGKPIKPGESGKGESGGGGGNGGSNTPTEPVTQYGTWEKALESSAVPQSVKQYIRFIFLDEYQGVNFKVIPNVIPVGDGFNTSIFDAGRNLWLGTDKGILILSQDGETTKTITAAESTEYLKYDKVTMLFSDGGNGAWVICGDGATEENAVCHIAQVK